MLNIALVQSATILGNIDENIKNVDKLLSGISNVDLVILPEMFSTGFSMKTELYAEPESGKALTFIREKAQLMNTAFIAGIMIDDEGKYYNRAYFVFPDGSYQYYNKRHLFSYGGEDKKYVAGAQKIIVNYCGWRICPLVCYDLRFPVWSRNCNNYDLLVYIASWPNARQTAWSTLPLARAMENQCYTATVNRVGKDKTGEYSGESKIVDALGNVIVQGKMDEQNVTIGQISLEELQHIREQFPFAKDSDSFELQ